MSLKFPENYDPKMDVRETQNAIRYIHDVFTRDFGKELNLERVSAPLFVTRSSGLNDNLNGVERPVSFDIPSVPVNDVEVVQSLAKWKRMALYRYGYKPGEGIYTDMNAIRRDDNVDNVHSIFVDQWMSTKNHIPSLIGVVTTLVALIIFGSESFLIPSMGLIIVFLFIYKFIRKEKNEDVK